jgi:putative endonuclease
MNTAKISRRRDETMDAKHGYVYIITDKPFGTLYVGVTSHLARRIYEHREGLYVGFSKKYRLKHLVYYEIYDTMLAAIQREKQIKKWKREWKIHNLIHVQNLEWCDLYDRLNQ